MANGFRGLIGLYFESSEKILKLYDELLPDIYGYYLRVNRMVFAKNIDEVKRSNDELLERRTIIRRKIQDLEKFLIETKLKNPKA